MDQKKTGSLLKELRKENGLTQEQLAEHFNVSARSVSRWENGNNMPDLSLLVEIADYYDVDIREIIDGERKSENMNQEEKETLLKVADYAENEKVNLMKRVSIISIVGLGALLFALLFVCFGLERKNAFFMCIEGIAFGLAVGALLTGSLFTTGILSKMRHNQKVQKVAKVLRVLCPLVAILSVLYCLCVSLNFIL